MSMVSSKQKAKALIWGVGNEKKGRTGHCKHLCEKSKTNACGSIVKIQNQGVGDSLKCACIACRRPSFNL